MTVLVGCCGGLQFASALQELGRFPECLRRTRVVRSGGGKFLVGDNGSAGITSVTLGLGQVHPSVTPVLVLRPGLDQCLEFVRGQFGAAGGQICQARVPMGVSGVGLGVGAHVTVEGLDRRTVGSPVVVHHAAQEVVHRLSGLHQFDQREVGVVLSGVVFDDGQVAVVASLGLPGQDERLGGLVLDAGAVGVYLRHVEDGIVLGDGGRVILQGNLDEGQFLAHADLERTIGYLGEGGLVGFDGGEVGAASVEGIPYPLVHVGGDDRPSGEIGAVFFGCRQRFVCTNESLGQQEVAVGGQITFGVGG